MKVQIPAPLRSYTNDRATVEAAGGTLAAVLEHLDAAYPGMRFRMIDEQERIREHIRFFVGGKLVADLAHAVGEEDEVMIVCSLSGG